MAESQSRSEARNSEARDAAALQALLIDKLEHLTESLIHPSSGKGVVIEACNAEGA